MPEEVLKLAESDDFELLAERVGQHQTCSGTFTKEGSMDVCVLEIHNNDCECVNFVIVMCHCIVCMGERRRIKM